MCFYVRQIYLRKKRQEKLLEQGAWYFVSMLEETQERGNESNQAIYK